MGQGHTTGIPSQEICAAVTSQRTTLAYFGWGLISHTGKTMKSKAKLQVKHRADISILLQVLHTTLSIGNLAVVHHTTQLLC